MSYYQEWNPQVHVAVSCMDWWNVKELFAALHYVQKFFKGDSHNLSKFKDPFRNLTSNLNCNMFTRFPENEVYICQSHKLWGKYIDKLIFYVSIVAGNKYDRGYENAGTRGEAEDHILALINNIYKEAECFEGLFDREYFKKYFNLEWIHIECHDDFYDIPVGAQWKIDKAAGLTPRLALPFGTIEH